MRNVNLTLKNLNNLLWSSNKGNLVFLTTTSLPLPHHWLCGSLESFPGRLHGLREINGTKVFMQLISFHLNHLDISFSEILPPPATPCPLFNTDLDLNKYNFLILFTFVFFLSCWLYHSIKLTEERALPEACFYLIPLVLCLLTTRQHKFLSITPSKESIRDGLAL